MFEEVNGDNPTPETPLEKVIVTSLGAVAIMLILVAPSGTFTIIELEIEIVRLTIPPPEAVYAHSKEFNFASGKGVLKFFDAIAESFPLPLVTAKTVYSVLEFNPVTRKLESEAPMVPLLEEAEAPLESWPALICAIDGWVTLPGAPSITTK